MYIYVRKRRRTAVPPSGVELKARTGCSRANINKRAEAGPPGCTVCSHSLGYTYHHFGLYSFPHSTNMSSSYSPLLLVKSGSLRYKSTSSMTPSIKETSPSAEGSATGGGSASGPTSPSLTDQLPKLRRVFTTHACRRRRKEEIQKKQERHLVVPGLTVCASPVLGSWRMSSAVGRRPTLGVAHSLPLGHPAFNRSDFLLFFSSHNLTCLN